MEQQKANLLLIDDHPLLRKGIAQLINTTDDLCVVGEASNGEDAIEMAVALDPDMIVLDLNMKGMDGIDVLRHLRDRDVFAKVIVFTVSDDYEDVVTAIKSGADGYLLKDMDPEELLEKLREAATGKSVYSEQLTDVLVKAMRVGKNSDETDVAKLTRRELQIVKCLAEGFSNKMIARELDIAEGTVKVHVKNLLKKMKWRSRMEAAVWALRNNSR